jgi:hypothetical protein
MASKASATQRRASMKRKGNGRSKRARRLAGDEPNGGGCSYVQKWSLLGDLGGYVQVFIPRKHYDRVAKGFLKRTKDPYARKLLRSRLAPLGVEWTCTGSCYGGWCEEHELGPNTYVCECAYFV